MRFRANQRRSTLCAARQPQVLARFEGDQHPPYLVSRQIGRGEVIFAASGLASSWNTLSTTNAVVVFDRILRSQMQATLPVRNFAARERLVLPPWLEPHRAEIERVLPPLASPVGAGGGEGRS